MEVSFLDSYLDIAKDLKSKGELDPKNDKFMDEIYDRLTDAVCFVLGDKCRTEVQMMIQKRFEEELL